MQYQRRMQSGHRESYRRLLTVILSDSRKLMHSRSNFAGNGLETRADRQGRYSPFQVASIDRQLHRTFGRRSTGFASKDLWQALKVGFFLNGFKVTGGQVWQDREHHQKVRSLSADDSRIDVRL